MKKHSGKFLKVTTVLFAAFVLWTLAVCFLDVGAIGPLNSTVGLSGINQFIHNLTGVNFTLYTITDWAGLIPVGVCLAFTILGLVQWIRRKNILKVDFSILVLGGFYILTIITYLFFEDFIINYRPVLINGYLEVSYPSSTTLLVLCVMPTTIMQLNSRIRNRIMKRCVSAVISVFIAFMVMGRIFSGVHWFSDIIGGILLSSGLVMLYYSVANMK